MVTVKTTPKKLQMIAVVCLFGAAYLWAYWTIFAGLVHVWTTDPQYSHALLLPLFALALLWQRRAELSALSRRPSWGGVPLLMAAALAQGVGAYFYSPWLEQMSGLVALAGLCLALGGWEFVRVIGPTGAFLLLMIPLPGRLDKALAGPLQQVATLASANALQTFGFFAHAEGNVILLSDYELGVVEACSGLRMLMVFLAVSTAVAILVRRSLLQRLLIIASSIPIAILCNVIRITTSGMMHETAGHEIANLVYHDVAGWLMAPMALVFLGIELLVFHRLFIPLGSADQPDKPRWVGVPARS